MIQWVRSEPYFQDSPLAATQVTVLFHIVRLRASEQSSAASMLGRHAIRWMANTISPDVGEWHVPDPNSAASRKAPDYFAIPHGDGWIEAMRVARGDTPSSTRNPANSATACNRAISIRRLMPIRGLRGCKFSV